MDLQLDEYERRKILEVLARDMRLQREEEMRLSNLKQDLFALKQRSALRTTAKSGPFSNVMVCGRCRDHFVTFSPSDYCRNCKHRTCKACRTPLENNRWLCKLCAVNRVYLAASGDWVSRKFKTYSNTGIVSSRLYNHLVTTVKMKQYRLTDSSPDVYHDSTKARLQQQRSGLSEEPTKLAKRFSAVSSCSGKASDKARASKSPCRRYKSDIDLNTQMTNILIDKAVSETLDKKIEKNENPGISNIAAADTEGLFLASTPFPKTKSTSDLIAVTQENDMSMKSKDKHKKASISMSVGGDMEKVGRCNRDNSLDVPSNRSYSSYRSTSTSNSNSIDQASMRSSITSMNSFMESSLDQSSVQGQIFLALYYNFRQGNLEVHIANCKGLRFTGHGPGVRPNPYVKTYLLPLDEKSGKHKRKTRSRKATTEPIYNEVLKYTGFTKSELESRMLYIGVWHSDSIGHNILIGETTVDLSNYPWSTTSQDLYSFNLCHRLPDDPSPCSETSVSLDTLAEVNLSVKFVPLNLRNQVDGSLHCLISSITNTEKKHMDVYLKAQLLDGLTTDLVKQKTITVHGHKDFMLNHVFVFDHQTLQGLKTKALTLFLVQQNAFSTKTIASATMGFINKGQPDDSGPGGTKQTKEADEEQMWRERRSLMMNASGG